MIPDDRDGTCVHCGQPLDQRDGEWFDQQTPPSRFCLARPGAQRHEPVR